MLTEKQKERIIGLYEFGIYTHQEIADIVQVPRFSVYQIYYNYMHPTEPFSTQKFDLANLSAAYQEYQAGATLRTIGKKYNISGERVRQIFKKDNLPTRKRTGAPRIYFQCKKGHKLGKGETRVKCQVCKKELKEFREKGLHLKTHCIHGHAYTKENTLCFKYTNGKPGRKCKKCHYQNMYNYFAKKNK